MKYISTRGLLDSKSGGEVLMEGLAPDGGLYVPEQYPRLSPRVLHSLYGKSYAEVAHFILSLFITDIPYDELGRIVAASYNATIFGTDEITPVEHIGNKKNFYLLKLSEGPTFAFKDVALQLVARLMEYQLKQSKKRLLIFGATSGDTGSAAEYALLGRKNIDVVMLLPEKGATSFQRAQIGSLIDPHIFNILLKGSFDDAQDIVKLLNEDAEFKKRFSIGAVNSINWMRIAAQVVYYVYAYLRVTQYRGEQVSFSIPSGNFGNALACHVARQMGIPIRQIIVATNVNDVLDEFFRTGRYAVRADVTLTSSPSMDIGKASNFERFVFDLCERNPEAVRACWKTLKETGSFQLERVSQGWASGSATDAEVIQTIRAVHKELGLVLDPHTAVAMKVGLEQAEEGVPLVVVETAQPVKFADTIREAIGTAPLLPKGYEDLESRPQRFTTLPASADAVREFIIQNIR